jgi:uncharacterized protein YaeQ
MNVSNFRNLVEARVQQTTGRADAESPAERQRRDDLATWSAWILKGMPPKIRQGWAPEVAASVAAATNTHATRAA